MRISRRFIATLVLFVFVLALVPPEKVYARFTALPDFYNQDPENVNPGSWPVDMYGDCDTVTVSLSQPSNPYIPYPVGPEYVEYEYARWTLESVNDFNHNPIDVDEIGNGLIIGDFDLDEPSGTTKSKTFNFKTPLDPGDPFYVIVRYTIVGGELGGGTGTFEVGDFDHPYWGARANDETIGTNVEFFCSQAVKDSAPSVTIIGDYVRAEGSGSTDQYLIQLQLDKPSTEDIWVDLETRDGGYFPDTYSALVGFNGYRSSPSYDPNPCDDIISDVEQAICEARVPDYTRHLIPAGDTYAQVIVNTRFANSTSTAYFYESIPQINVIRASNAFLGLSVIQGPKHLRSRNDDGCDSGGNPELECGYAYVYPGGSDFDERDKVSFTVANLKSTDINPNTGVATFTVNLVDSSGANSNPYTSVEISYSTGVVAFTDHPEAFATPDVDFVATSGTVTFASGEASKTVDIPLLVDPPGDEGFEIFNVTFSKTSIDGGSPLDADAVTVGAVIPDTAVLPVMTLAATDATKSEGDSGTTNFTFAVNLNKGAIGDQIVNYAVSGTGTNPADASDFVGGSFPVDSITINSGENSGTITIPVNGDLGFEQHETFTVTISAGSSGLATGATLSQIGTINNDDLAPVNLFGTVPITEADAEANKIQFTVVSEDGPVIGAQTVDYVVTASGANPVDVDDFGGSFPSGTVTILDGESSVELAIPYVDDAIVEPDETFTLTITPTGSGITDGETLEAIVTVSDDDSASITIEDVSQAEGNLSSSTFTFTATLNVAVIGGVSVNYSTDDGTATTADADYVGTYGTLTFVGDAGETQTFAVTVNGDTVIEPDETFSVLLSGASNDAVDVSDTALGTILNDEQGLLSNGGFEIAGDKEKFAEDWTTSKLSKNKDRRKCNGNKIVAAEGECAFRFKFKDTILLTQNQRIFLHTIRRIRQVIQEPDVNVGDTLLFSSLVKAGNLQGKAKIIVKVVYGPNRPDDVDKFKFVVEQGTYDYTPITGSLIVTRVPEKIVVVIKAGDSTGTFWLDDLNLTLVQTSVAPVLTRSGQVPIDLPEPPATFRD